MARYILQSDSDSLDLEYYIIENLLKKNKYLHDYEITDEKSLMDIASKDDIPIGNIGFVMKWLNETHGIVKENPIEIPKYLRTEEFLKRNYRIVTWEDIPRQGKFFLKDVSELKSFGDIINATYTDVDELFNYVPRGTFDPTLVLDKSHLFQVSSQFNIKSEYRVYVINGEIENIGHYNGDCTLLPDIDLIKKAVGLINLNEKWLKSYTLDIMVGPQGTAIIEIHNFASVGLYSNQWGSNLLYAYKQGIDYLINDNHEIEV